MIGSQHIVSHGTINIDPAHPNEEPIVDYRALSNPIDIDVMVENIKFMRKYMNSSDFAAYAPREVTPGAGVTGEALRQWVRNNHIPTLYHPIATAAKKPQSLGGVVDEELRVHGTQRLRVIDGSVIPLLPGANTQSTVYMLAEKVCFNLAQIIWAFEEILLIYARLLTSSRQPGKHRALAAFGPSLYPFIVQDLGLEGPL